MNKLELQTHPTLLSLVEACRLVRGIPNASQVTEELQINCISNSLEHLLSLYLFIARPGFEPGAKLSIRSYDELVLTEIGFAGDRDNLFIFNLTFENEVTLCEVSMDEIVVLPSN